VSGAGGESRQGIGADDRLWKIHRLVGLCRCTASRRSIGSRDLRPSSSSREHTNPVDQT
jgi:hypothetical protein